MKLSELIISSLQWSQATHVQWSIEGLRVTRGRTFPWVAGTLSVTFSIEVLAFVVDGLLLGEEPEITQVNRHALVFL